MAGGVQVSSGGLAGAGADVWLVMEGCGTFSIGDVFPTDQIVPHLVCGDRALVGAGSGPWPLDEAGIPVG